MVDPDGYLGLSIDGTSPSIAITNLCLMSICVIIQMAVGMMGIQQTINNDKDQRQFTVLFVLCLICCPLGSALAVVSYAMYWKFVNATIGAMAFGVARTSAFSVFCCLLLIAVLRLRFVFRDFMTMSVRTYVEFKCLFVLIFGNICALCVVVAVAVVLIIQDPLREDDGPQWRSVAEQVLTLSFWILYAVGSFSAIRLFVNNVRRLALSQRPRPEDAPQNLEALRSEDVMFGEQQEPLINVATKYMLLFMIAVSWNILTVALLGNAVSWESGIPSVFLVIDLTINLLCVYLQFAFATKQYMRCCGCIHRRWRNRVDLIARKAIRKSIQLVAHKGLEHSALPSSCATGGG